MKIENAYLPDEVRDSILAESGKINIKSNLTFMRAHNGLRIGKLHLALGSSHVGKSTLIRSIVIDVLEGNNSSQILVYLSEEDRIDFLTELYSSGINNKQQLERLVVVSELENHVDDNLNFFESVLDSKKFDVCIFDNITTSVSYMDKTPAHQAKMATKFKQLASSKNTALLLIAHTEGKITNNYEHLINMQNIRGSKTITNLAEFCYVMQSFISKEKIYPTIRIEKHRGQRCDERLHFLHYSMERKFYHHSMAIDFDKFKEMFKERNKL